MPNAMKFADGSMFSSSQISIIKVLMRQLHTDVPDAATVAFPLGRVCALESQTACGQDGPNAGGIECLGYPATLLVRRNKSAIVNVFRYGAEMC